MLAQICRAAEDACGFIEGMSRDDFLADKRTQPAVVTSLVIIGEASARNMDRYPRFVAARPRLPWRSMRGMRNRIAHGCFELDPAIVRDTVRGALPDLLARIRAIAPEAE